MMSELRTLSFCYEGCYEQAASFHIARALVVRL